MSGGRCTQSDSAGGSTGTVRNCVCGLGCTRGVGLHWRNIANTAEPSVCGGDAALCQITNAIKIRYMRTFYLFQNSFFLFRARNMVCDHGKVPKSNLNPLTHAALDSHFVSVTNFEPSRTEFDWRHILVK